MFPAWFSFTRLDITDSVAWSGRIGTGLPCGMSSVSSRRMNTSDSLTRFVNLRVELHNEKAALESRLDEITRVLGGSVPAAKAQAPAPANLAPKSQQRTMSAATRAKIAAAVKARWARTKGTASTPAKKQKPVISAAGIERIRAAQKARWAKLKAEKTA